MSRLLLAGIAAIVVATLAACSGPAPEAAPAPADAVPAPAPTPEPPATPDIALSRAVATPTPAPTTTPIPPEIGVVGTMIPRPEPSVRLLVVSDGSHDSLLLEWSAGPPDTTKWQYRRGVWRRYPDGDACGTQEDSGCWRRDDDGGRIWWLYFGAWTDIPGSGASTRSFRDTGLPAGSAWEYQVRAVVGTVATEGSWVERGGTQEQGRQFLDIYASDVVEGDGQRRWLVLDFTIVIPDGVRVAAYGAYPHRELEVSDAYSYREGAEWAELSVWGADSIIYGAWDGELAGDEELGGLRLGPDGEVLRRYVPDLYVPPDHTSHGVVVLDQIVASVRALDSTAEAAPAAPSPPPPPPAAPSPSPVPSPTPSATAAPSSGQRGPQPTSRLGHTVHALTEILPWFRDPPDDGHAYVVDPLVEIWLTDAALGAAAAQAPWLGDGIGVLEPNALYGLLHLYDRDPALAQRMLAYSVEEPVRSRNVLLLNVLGELARQQPERFELLSGQPWFTDGLDAEERAFSVALAKVAGSGALYRDLLASHSTRSADVDLPLSGAVRLWLFHHGAFAAGDDVLLAELARSVGALERLLGRPFPLTDVIVLLVDGWEYEADSYGGVNFGDSLIIIRAREQELAGLLRHELAHFYLAFEVGPPWLVEGGANFAQAYIRAWDGSEGWEGQVPADEYARAACAEHGVPNVHALSDPYPPDRVWRDTCHYALGQHFLTVLFNTIGEAAFSAALGELYERYQAFRFHPGDEQVYRVFLDQAPPERRAALLEVWRQLHGGPFLDGE